MGSVITDLPHVSSNKSPSSSLIRQMYLGHFFARWSARMWEFSVGLYMIHIWPESLLLTAVYGVIEAASLSLFGTLIGKWVDKFTYMQIIRAWLLTQGLSFLVAGGAVIALLVYHDCRQATSSLFIMLVIITNISGAIGVLSTLAGTILIEREWVVVISNGQPPSVQTQMNSIIRRIDLTCKLLAPVFSGFIISFISLKASATILALWNVGSVLLQYCLLKSVYFGIPVINESSKRKKMKNNPADDLDNTISIGERNYVVEVSYWKDRIIKQLLKFGCFDAWIVYAKQEVVLPGVALALLYFNVLSFGTLMTATLKQKDIPAYVIGIMRGISAIVGISATVLYPVVQSHISTLRTGLWSIWTQCCFLLVCVSSIWIKNSITSAWILMGGVAASRIGLWMFDLSVMQQMQDQVSETDRCIVGGVQNSLQSMFQLLTFVMGIIISNPKDFSELVVLSFISVSLATFLYTLHVYRIEKCIFQFELVDNDAMEMNTISESISC